MKATEYFQQYEDQLKETLLRNKIEVRSQLGKGAYGIVLSCYSHLYEMEFAIKIFPLKISPNITQSFEREIELLSSLDHPNVIRIFKQFRDDYFAYIIMELCTNGSLQDYIMQNYPIPIKEALRIFQELAMAVHYCHQNHVIHNDIKPQNVLLASGNRVKLTDFGISVRESQMRECRQNYQAGTLTFMPPERVSKPSPFRYAGDVWALGITLFFMTLGTLPWHTTNKDWIIKDILGFSYSPRCELNQTVNKLLVGMLRIDPDSRISTSEIIDVLRPSTVCNLKSESMPHFASLPKVPSSKLFYLTARRTLSKSRQASIYRMQNLPKIISDESND